MGRCGLALWALLAGGCGPSILHNRPDGDGAGEAVDLSAAAPDLLPPVDLAVCDVGCSGDATQVIDCHGVPLATCGPGESCAEGACATPCERARKARASVGCEYYVVNPADEGNIDGACLAAILANTSAAPVTITLEYQGRAYPAADFARVPVGQGDALRYQALPPTGIPPGQVAIVFLAQGPELARNAVACPAPAAFTAADAASSGTAIIDAFHLTTSAPVVAFDIFPYGGAASAASSATLLVPTSAWDDNYIAVDGWPPPGHTLQQPFVQIVAASDGTTVSIRPTVDIVGGPGVAAGARGQVVSYTLQKGQALQLKQDEELNGSAITASGPVGVWGGSACMNIDVNDPFCDAAQQQLFPVRALGSEYVAARPRDRVAGKAEAPPWRLVGAVDGTRLTYDPARPPGAPAVIGRGELVTFWTGDAFVVRSQDLGHPFYLSGHMTGADFHGSGYVVGDPEFVNVIPPRQYLPAYGFFTDATMGYTHLVLVRAAGGDGRFHDVTLDCLGTVGGWAPVGQGGQYQVARVDLVYRGDPVGACNNGFHAARSDLPFGLTVWGWDRAVSYAYPAGASVAPINDIVIQ